MLYDVFISHASEDKRSLVRPLAQALKEERVEVWYDEFTLRPGDSLRRSIDKGLSRSRHGIVVLSQNLFGKNWPQWELDGLVQRQMEGKGRIIIPIWHNIGRAEVLAYSPPLADCIAIDSALGLKEIVQRLLLVVRPDGSTLLIARDRMMELGFDPPVVTDDWWLDVIEHSGSNESEGGLQEDTGWGRWGFPFPPRGSSPAERGERLAWAGLQMLWQDEADRLQICQMTTPDDVHRFLSAQPGMMQRAFDFPWFLAAYAPQLTMEGFGGEFEPFFEEWLANSLKEQAKIGKSGSGKALTTNGLVPLCTEAIALRHPTFGNYQAPMVAALFVGSTDPFTGPPAELFDHIEFIAWFLSSKSDWLPRKTHAYLSIGLAEWAVWPWNPGRSTYSKYSGEAHTGKLRELLSKASSKQKFRLTRTARKDLSDRLRFSVSLLQLPESAATLETRFLESGYIEAWFEAREKKII